MGVVDWLGGEWLRGIRLGHRIPIKLALTQHQSDYLAFIMPAASFQTPFGTISRGAVGRRLRRRDAPFTAYPRLEEMTRRAEACGGGDQADAFDDLYLEDLVYANAISAAKILDCERVSGANPNLTGLIKRGLADREVSEDIGKGIEIRAMRYSAAMAAQLLDHTSDVTERVSLESASV
jgi:hypothetical protein